MDQDIRLKHKRNHLFFMRKGVIIMSELIVKILTDSKVRDSKKLKKVLPSSARAFNPWTAA